MATLQLRGLVLSAAILAALPACGSTVGGGGTGAGNTGTGNGKGNGGTGGGAAVEPESHYAGQGFVVHEWGTNTVVVGSDGSAQRGLHHEEEDLPGFVYNRLSLVNPRGAQSVVVKMETPVTYFYSDKPLTVNASVSFPKGVFTQWYPAEMAFHPPVADLGSKVGVDERTDPVFDLDFPFDSEACAKKFGSVADGLLDWGAVDVLGRGEEPFMVEAPLEKFTWSYARQVASNPVRILGVPDEKEKFLFYRGLGNFDLPVSVTSSSQQQVSLHNGYGEAIGRVFVINVGASGGAFEVHQAGIAAGQALDAKVPAAAGLAMDDFVETLGAAVTTALDATGLYHDESVAMVNTWKRQWFRTPGIRVLYLMPQSWTDASIPLTIVPEPDKSVRVMMIRTEVITPEMEAADKDQATLLGGDAATAAAAQTYFVALGRFAEPRLRRALALLGNPAYAATFLATVATADTRQTAGE